MKIATQASAHDLHAQLPTSQVPTPATNRSAQPILGAFAAYRGEPAVAPRTDAPLAKPPALALQTRPFREASSIRSVGSSLERLDLPLSKVVPASALLTLKNGVGSRTSFSGERGEQIEALHEPEYKLIRTFFRHSKDVVNIDLSDDGKTVRSITGYPSVSLDKLQSLVTAGLLSRGLLPILGVSQEQVKIATEAAAHDRQLNQQLNQQLIPRLQKNSVEELPSIENYSGTHHNTKIVGQGEAHFLSSAKPDVHGLYTSRACSCLILIAVVKNAVGKPEHVAMAHLDNYVKDQAADQFFGALPASGTVEVTLLAGNQENAKRAINAADKAGAVVVFADAGNEPLEGYCAAVDRDGGIYFGTRLSLSEQTDSAKANIRNRKHMMNGNSLPISEQLRAQFHV